MLDILNQTSTRRGFLKGLLGTGAAASLYGCGGPTDDDVIYLTPSEEEETEEKGKYYYGTSAHNCGGRCIIRGEVVKGKIVRFLTDESIIGYGTGGAPGVINMDSPDCSQSRACSRCRSYKFRLYHAGRLKYPMKQTKKRGDLTGFVRISWDQALTEIAEKHQLTYGKYGPDGIYNNYASAAGGNQGASTWGNVFNLLGGYVNYWGSYSSHQWQYIKNAYTGFPMNISSTGQGYSTRYMGNSYHANCNDVANDTKNVVMFGSNYMTTYHQYSYSTMRALEEMRKRNPASKAIFIGPEFVDQGVTVATEWVRSKPYTDPALILAMMYHMIVNTYDKNGNLLPNPMLDINYLDTMVYGFFDSPEYWIDQETGIITLTPPATPQYWVPIVRKETGANRTVDYKTIRIAWEHKVITPNRPAIGTAYGSDEYSFTYVQGIRRVDAVPAGRSLSAYIMGSDDRLTKVSYSSANNYVAQSYGAITRNLAACSYVNSGGVNTKYQTKRDFTDPKSPEWADSITGIPAAKIWELAELYADEANHPIYTEWCGGGQKQADGVMNLFMIQTLKVVTKCWGKPGAGYGRGIDAAFTKAAAADTISVASYGTAARPATPTPSCTAWHNSTKVAYKAAMLAASPPYAAKAMPDFQGANIGGFYMDDGGAKALLAWDRSGNSVNTIADSDHSGREFYKWRGAPASVGDAGDRNSAVYSSFRLIFNCGGNILVNQHECCNDLVEVWEAIPSYNAANDKADALCLVTFDNFLSPTPRWSDYVLPAATTWEQPTVIEPIMGRNVYIPKLTQPPGESLSQFDFQRSFLKKYGELDASKVALQTTFTWGKPGKTIEDCVLESFAAVSSKTTSPYYRKSWDEFLSQAYLPGVPDETTKKLTASSMRQDLDDYLSPTNDAARPTTPFMAVTAGSTEDGKGVFVYTYHAAENMESDATGSYGNQFMGFDMPSKAFPTDITRAPQPSGRMQVYSPTYVWQYEWRFSKWHGWLPLAERGQENADLEGDPIIYPIPMYFAYEDYHMEAYGGRTPAEVFAYDANGPLLLTTTHDRFRSHSTHAENAYLREFTHRTIRGSTGNNEGSHTIKPGGLYSGDDWNEYALSSPLNGDMELNASGEIPRLNKPIQYRQGNATYTDIWINPRDANKRGIVDGDLLLVENPFGKVRVAARVTERAVEGFVGLHQGCWFDPDPIDGVDDGGCCNTLMSQRHSRADHGNGQQSAMVSVKKA